MGDTTEGLDEDIRKIVKERSISELFKVHIKDKVGVIPKRNKKRRFKPKRKSVTNAPKHTNKRRMKPKIEKKTTDIPLKNKKTTKMAHDKDNKHEDVTSDLGKIHDAKISEKNE